MAGLTDGISPAAGFYEDSLGRDGCLNKDGGANLYHAFGSAHVASYHKATWRILDR